MSLRPYLVPMPEVSGPVHAIDVDGRVWPCACQSRQDACAAIPYSAATVLTGRPRCFANKVGYGGTKGEERSPDTLRILLSSYNSSKISFFSLPSLTLIAICIETKDSRESDIKVCLQGPIACHAHLQQSCLQLRRLFMLDG